MTVINIPFRLNSLYFIVSLTGAHRGSADDLFTYHISGNFKETEKKEKLYVESKKELFETLDNIATALDKDESPLIHIEAHGIDSGKGIALSNDEQVQWEEMRDYFRTINIKSCNNLTLSIAACHSGYIVSELVNSFYESLESKAPFFAFIGSKGVITLDELNIAMPAFYISLNETKDWKIATDEANQKAGTNLITTTSYTICIKHIQNIANEWVKNRFKNLYADPTGTSRFFCALYQYTYQKPCNMLTFIRMMKDESFYIDFFNRRLDDFLMVTDCPELNIGRYQKIKRIENFEKSLEGVKIVRRN